MLPLTDPRPSLLLLSTGGATDRPFPCRSLEYRETSSLTVPEGINFYEKPAPIAYERSFSGSTAYGAASGRIEVSGAAVLDGRTIRASAVVRLSFDSAVCPAEFAAEIKTGLDKFREFKYGPIGLTPKSAPHVTDISAEFTEGVNAFLAQKYQLAITRLKPFAERGSAKAQSYLGSMYESGRGVERNYTEAIRWFLMAAEQSDAYSQSHLGYLYEKRLGAARGAMVRQGSRARRRLQPGSPGGDVSRRSRGCPGLSAGCELVFEGGRSRLDLGASQSRIALRQRRGVPQDRAKGIVLLRNAADQNDSDAQYNLGWAYESGTGVPKDTQEAIKWYGKASDRGNAQAQARLEGLTAANSFWQILFRHIRLLDAL